MTVEAFEKILEACDQTSFRDVNYALFLCCLYFSFSRTETPCPKTWTGAETFDPDQHWQVIDIQIVFRDGIHVLGVRFKRTKPDARIERPEADPRGEGDWAYIGDVPDTIFSIFMWYRLLMGFFPDGRKADEPFFLAQDRTRAYTYSCGEKDHRRKIIDAGMDPSVEGTLHGARVGGNDATSRNHPLGPEMAKAHGGWKSWQGKTRYDRFGIRADVAPIAAYIVGAPNPYFVRPRRQAKLVTLAGGPASRSARPPGFAAAGSDSDDELPDLVDELDYDSVEDEDEPAPVPVLNVSSPRAVRKGKRTKRLSAGAPSTASVAHVASPLPSVLASVASTSQDPPSPRVFPAHLPPGWTTDTLEGRKGLLGTRTYTMHRCDFMDGSYLQAPSIPKAWLIFEDFLQSKNASAPMASGDLASAMVGRAEASKVAPQVSPPAPATPTPPVPTPDYRAQRAASRTAHSAQKVSSSKKKAKAQRHLTKEIRALSQDFALRIE